MSWSIWALLGLALLATELFTPGGFFLCFFGAGALIVAFFSGIGGTEEAWQQWLLFSLSSVVLLIVLRKRLIARVSPPGNSGDIDAIIGSMGKAQTLISVNGSGQVEVRGSPWKGKNVGDSEIVSGTPITVVGQEGLMLLVKGE